MVNQKKKISKCEDHYPWECISIYRRKWVSTIDFVIPDHKAMLCLLHFLHQKLFDPINLKFMSYFKRQKLMMKLHYEAWNR